MCVHRVCGVSLGVRSPVTALLGASMLTSGAELLSIR